MDKEDIKNIYDKIEDAVVDTYKRVEKAAVEGYQKVEDAAVEKLFAKEGETAQQAKSRLRGEAPAEIVRIETEHAPAAIGPYSQAIDTGMGVVFVSGQLPIDPATGAFPEGGIQEQTRQSLLNASAILLSVGLDFTRVVKTTVFLADMGDFAAMNEVYAQFFRAPFPARSAVAVRTLPKGALVEIECIAVK